MPQTFTTKELARFDGQEGRPAYVAVDGVVYDVSASATWLDGHHGPCDISSSAGRDLSAEIRLAPARMRGLLEQKPAVGRLVAGNGRTRAAAQAGLAAVAALVLAVPFIAMGLDGFGVPPAIFAALRTLALVAFSLLFLNAVVGAYRPLLNRVYRADRLQDVHNAVAALLFTLALAHGILVLTQGIGGYVWQVLLGPVVLVLLVLTIAAAKQRNRLRRVWRWIHRLNYAVFAFAAGHALVLGYNLATQPFLKVIVFVYLAVAAAGLGYRVGVAVRGSRRAR